MDRNHAWARLAEIDRSLVLLSHIAAVLEWDQELWAPAKEAPERGEEMALVASRRHALSSGDEMGDVLAGLGADDAHPEGDGRDDFERGLIRLSYTAWRKGRSVPASLVGRISSATSRGYAAWLEARRQRRWSLLVPAFREILDLKREQASLARLPGQSLYDAMLDDYEEGATTGAVDSLFGAMVPVLQDIVRRTAPADDAFLRGTFPIEGQKRIHDQVMAWMGFDFSRGLKGESAHPFTSALGVDDVRITTRYDDPGVMDPFYSVVHETGHALYEQWASQGRLKGTGLAGGASYALHESQSRLWENIIGKSRPFLQRVWPLFLREFPERFSGVSFERFYRAVNKVEPSCIRTNADEVTYGLHIVLRYELEKRLVAGSLKVEEVPEAWNALSRSLLGIVPPDDALGCLQDVHWASGEIGYFPTYALGNFYGAQIWAKLRTEVDAPAVLSGGDWSPVTRWLGEHVWRWGMTYTPAALIRKMSGRDLDASFFTTYLQEKYKELQA